MGRSDVSLKSVENCTGTIVTESLLFDISYGLSKIVLLFPGSIEYVVVFS